MPEDATLQEWLRVVVWGCFLYLLSNYVLFAILAVVGAIESALRHLQARAEDFESMSLSRFTIPVSVIVPAFNEAAIITSSVESLLALDYPEFEVIVVNDGSDDETLERLKQDFELELRHVFYRRIFPTQPIRGVYRSRTEPRICVVDKVNAGKADALNCGVNFARYRYLCCVDADAIFEPDALLQTMRLIVKDPATIVGLTSTIAVSSRPSAWHRAEAGAHRKDRGVFSSFQHFDYARSFLNNRLAWSRFRFMLCSIGVFAIWRRDVIVELDGFSPEFTCEDIEMTFRVHEHFMRKKRRYEILCTPEIVAVTEAPERISSLIHQRARWQRVIIETLWHYRSMLLRPRYFSKRLRRSSRWLRCLPFRSRRFWACFHGESSSSSWGVSPSRMRFSRTGPSCSTTEGHVATRCARKRASSGSHCSTMRFIVRLFLSPGGADSSGFFAATSIGTSSRGIGGRRLELTLDVCAKKRVYADSCG